MAHRSELEYPYEASDEASESELLDRSLSVWSGLPCFIGDDFAPIALDLHTASSIGHYECVKSIIEKNEEDLNRRNKGGWTALMYASYIGYDTVVNLLLEAGVDVNTRNSKGLTPLMLASSCGNESIAYFLLQQGAEIEAKDNRGWTALFHSTFSGHQNMVKFLLDNGANMNAVSGRASDHGMTPFMEAASAGHEIIVQYFLQHGVDVNMKTSSGETARSLALMKGHHKIIGFIDNHVLGNLQGRCVIDQDCRLSQEYLSSSDEAFPSGVKRPASRHARPGRSKGVSIQDGPSAVEGLMDRVMATVEKKRNLTVKRPINNAFVPRDYVAFAGSAGDDCGAVGKNFRYRDVTSPINVGDHGLDSSGGKDSLENDEDCNVFSQTGALTIRSSSSSSNELAAAFEICRKINSEEAHAEQSTIANYTNREEPNLTSDKTVPVGVRPPPTLPRTGPLPRAFDVDSLVNSHVAPSCLGVDRDALVTLNPQSLSRQARVEQHQMLCGRPQTLAELLEELNLMKYLPVFDEQDVDLQVFLTLTDNDLHEIGIKLFGPRKKMNVAIARWHSNARPSGNDLEQAYADRLETEMQEMAIQLHQANNLAEQMKHQLVLEQKLRSVTESCLMEDRSTSQHICHLSADNLTRCVSAIELLGNVSVYKDEICRRLPCDRLAQIHASEPNNELNSHRDSSGLAKLNASEIHNLSNQQLLAKMHRFHEELSQTLSTILTNTEEILKKQFKTMAPGFAGTSPR